MTSATSPCATVESLQAHERAGSRTTRREALDRRLATVTAELSNLTEMAARGGSIPVILDALKKREDERRALSAELDALKREPNVIALVQPHAVRRELRALLEDWQQLAAGEVDEARGVLSTVLRDRVAFQAVDVEGGKSYELTIPIAFERVMRAVIPASNWKSAPTGFEPVFWP